MIHFYDELWNIQQLLVLKVLNEKEIIPIRKAENWPKQKIGQGRILCPDTVSECRDKTLIELIGVMSQQGSS